ncbi:hypothetical protein CGRA01v4_11569 [Colletotrichum graminicola]|nr:hypothetical protein CGRA01v4_11569 [Colletotrichum graminicola]
MRLFWTRRECFAGRWLPRAEPPLSPFLAMGTMG